MQKLVKLLTEKRASLGITQKEAARLLGYQTKQHISNIERGDGFSLELGIKIAKAYGVKKKELIEIVEAETKSYLKKLIDEIYT